MLQLVSESLEEHRGFITPKERKQLRRECEAAAVSLKSELSLPEFIRLMVRRRDHFPVANNPQRL